ncbi:cob(I)yrinic acid a,c-diamide adenosyltransferase [Sulfitobacter sp. M57]|uniref:cob(I)yrinic acid a,c-diamide adenosyltransferase n=1 Tax=unclassified Sulfitobacter TaxID=196795 RepID=UPI0023E1DA15|nr:MULTISPECIES: cob(I)yrinic acid a,c-diamide adenosyltransferase [unclassified Sulfitobacter]MDF3414868.1 cob(I)yrinic acid a,c-diamide adenosyltransferase [Sulfitobacter sp. KE5]MDF3422349.1 cob(I)yrinic acid a,c-diamide adenosyltransferase [Sulfitobacter sp. KE43]MDF3433414.1 cob(I)yrinic acid a,c-diamide adenosyltransferase [Sulfitobacter sp. KE42]MDF3459054.1 cob(I)yrinic acid a,c-diamide adenosyltransferase [Sulfitobacter sp. S74]MDF3462953.1 cob(I)yrinic acid a,c-diamide adenosyltransf
MSDDDHKQKMQERQTQQRKKVSELVDPKKGLVLIHTGAGKGKSSSAFGVVVRALGWKQKVGVIQFIKGKWKTGERQFFDRLGEVTWHTMGEGFTWDTQDKDRDIAAAQAAFAKGREMMESGEYDLIVMDEINIAMRYDYLSVADVIAGLDARDKRTGVILTGRDAKPELCEYADLVTEMTEVKHPFKAGIKAQRGVDF